MHDPLVTRLPHGHHEIAASLFVGSLILGGALILSAELTKPERYEFYLGTDPSKYVVYDRNTGRATQVEFNTKSPLQNLSE